MPWNSNSHRCMSRTSCSYSEQLNCGIIGLRALVERAKVTRSSYMSKGLTQLKFAVVDAVDCVSH